MFDRKALLVPLVCLLSLFLGALTTIDEKLLISTRSVGAQTVCTPPLYQGYPSSCSNIYLRWLNRDSISLIDHFEIYRGGLKIGQVPGNAITFSENVGCSFSSSYTIKQVMKSGASCQTTTTGNPPHTAPCDICSGGGGPGTLNIVSAASYTAPVAPGSIATIFANPGQVLTTTTAPALGLPLPTDISGTRVLLNGNPTGLFYVSPTQINFLLPDNAVGTINVSITGSSGEKTDGAILTAPNPAIFTVNSTGSGVAAAVVTPDGRNYQSVSDASGNAIPISVGSSSQPNFLILFGTGLRTQGPVQVRIGGRDCVVTYSGPHSQLAGVDQLNVRMIESLRGAGSVQVTVLVGGFVANFTRVTIGS